MNADSDYARVLAELSKARLAPYVAYTAQDSINGLGKKSSTRHVVVRVSDGKVVSGTSNFTVMTGSDDERATNPVSSPIFDPACYRATGESVVTFEGQAALKLSLAPVCREKQSSDHDYAFTELYVNPIDFHPIDAHGAVPSDDDSKNVSVQLDQRFATFDGRVMPSAMSVDVSGSGWMFWLQVHVHEVYSDYRFLNSPSA